MATTPTTQATDQKLTSRIWNPGCRKYPEKRRWSTQKNVEATSIGAWPMIHRSTQKISRKHQSHMINPENTKKNTDDQPRKMSKPHQSELDPWYTNQPSKYLENIEATWLTQKNAQINPNPKPITHGPPCQSTTWPMIHRSEQTTPTSEQTHRNHIEPIRANNIEREEREREKERETRRTELREWVCVFAFFSPLLFC